MNKIRKQIIWITCLIAVLTLGVTTANISKADRSSQREIVDNISDEVKDADNDDNKEDKKNDIESIDDRTNQDDDSKSSNEENDNDSIDSIDDINNNDKDSNLYDSNKDDKNDKDNKSNNEMNEDEELNKEDDYSSSKKDKDYSNSSKTAYEIFMGNGLHVIGRVYAQDNKPLAFDGKWFALEDTQYVYALEESQEDDITLYKAYVLIDNKESYIYFNVDEAKTVNVIGYKEEKSSSVSNNGYNQSKDYKTITPDLKVTPIYKYINKDTGEEGKRYGNETIVGEKVIVSKELKKWSSAEM